MSAFFTIQPANFDGTHDPVGPWLVKELGSGKVRGTFDDQRDAADFKAWLDTQARVWERIARELAEVE